MLMRIGDYHVALTKKAIKRIYLRITKSGQIKISAPLYCSDAIILQFLNDRYDWIAKNLQRLQRLSSNYDLRYQTGETLHLWGKPYELMVYYRNKQSVLIQGNIIYLDVKSHADVSMRHALIKRWHRVQMRTVLPKLISRWENKIGVHVKSWGIKAMKTRWGSCNVKEKRIWVNLKLVQAPEKCLEYVIVHELTHLLEPSHNKRFYALMERVMPDWRLHHKTLSDCVQLGQIV